MTKTPADESIQEAVAALRRGGIIAYPTEAVFGLGCDPRQPHSIQRLLDIKQRPAAKGLILIASTVAQLVPYLDLSQLSAARWQEIQSCWPGPVTWLVPAAAQVGAEIRGVHTSVAVRVSAHARVQALCDAFDGAIISTSANLSGQPPARSAAQTRAQLGERLDYILPGEVGGARNPSEIRDARSGKIIRPADDNETKHE
ncbi:MAG: Sua5/YciO/YrdC/YwlC family protein [Gammaproteobacteria bacterium]